MFLTDPPMDPVVEAAYADDVAEDGYVHNATRAWGWRPDVAEAFAECRSRLGSGLALSSREVAVVISATVSSIDDSYCSLVWGSRLAELASDDVAHAVLADSPHELLSPRESALAAWARLVAHDANTTTQEDVERLRAVGLTDRDIAGVTMLVAFRVAFSTFNDALGTPPDRQASERAPHGVLSAVRFGRPPGTD